MSAEIVFIIASLIFWLAVVVGANIWAVAEPRETDLQRSLSKALDEIVDAELPAGEGPPNAPPLPRRP